MEKKVIAGRNLRKALYFGGSMASLSAVTGLAVAIPLYYKIQNELKQNFSKLADLSGFMNELIAKLGIADASFSKELSSGYQVVYKNGKTQIYKTAGGERSLVMNMNADGTIGSAAKYDGVAAQQIISVVTDAVTLMESDAKAMDDILGPIAKQAEQTSVEIESAITGVSQEQLIIRNRLADGKTPADIEAELGKAISHADLKTAGDLVEEAKKIQTMSEDDKKALEAQQLQNVKDNSEPLKIAYIKYLKGYTNDTDAKNDPDFNLTVEELKELFDTRKNQEAMTASQAMQSKATEKAIERGPSPTLINNIISSPSRFVNMFARSFGFQPLSGPTVEGTSALRGAIYTGLQTVWANRNDMLRASFGQLTNLIGHQLLGYDQTITTNWKTINSKPTRKVQATELVNTYGSKTAEDKGLIVLNVKLTLADGTNHNGYVVAHARESGPSVLDWESARAFFDISIDGRVYTQEKLDTIKYLARISTANVHDLVKKEAIKKLIAISKGQSDVKALRDPHLLEKLDVFSSHLSTISERYINNFFSTLTFDIASNTLFDERNYNFDPKNFIKASEVVIQRDTNVQPGVVNVPANDDKTENPKSYFGNWMQKLNAYISSSQTDYSAVINNLSNFFDLLKDSNLRNELKEIIHTGNDEDWNILTEANQGVIKLLTSTDATITEYISKLFQHGKTRYSIHEITTHINDINLLINHIKQLLASDKTTGLTLAHTYWGLNKFLLTSSQTDISTLANYAITLYKENIYRNILEDNSFRNFFSEAGSKALELLTSTSTDNNIKALLAPKTSSGNFAITPETLLSWTSEIGKTDKVADLTTFKQHINQLIAVGGSDLTYINKLITNNLQFVKGVLLSPKADITFEVSDAVKLIELNPNFDMNDADNIQKVQAASGVSEALASQGLTQTQVDAISNQVRSTLTNTGATALTPEEFKEVVEYTKTVFDVFTTTTDAVDQLKKVLDPTTLKANVDKITKFNEWIESIKSTLAPGTVITQKMIEDYVWTYKGVVVHDTPSLPWDDTNHPPVTSIIPTTHDGLTTVFHNGGGLVKVEMPSGTSGPRFTDIFPASGTNNPLSDPGMQWSSTGAFDPVHNIVISGNLVMKNSRGKILIWDLKTHTMRHYVVANTGGVAADYIRNIIVTAKGKVVLVDESGKMFALTKTIDQILALTEGSQVGLAAFNSDHNVDFGTVLSNVFAVGQYTDKNGDTLAVISDKSATNPPYTSKITIINLDTGELVSQTPIGDYFYALSVDQDNGFAYAIGETGKQLWRIDIDDPTKSEMLLAINDLKDQNGALNSVPEAGTTFRGIFYDSEKHEIVAATGNHWMWIADNTEELQDIFDYLMKH